MAEEEVPRFRNKGLLLVAVILGGLVVVIYNVHINKVRTSLEGKQVRLLKFTRSMQAGDKIDARDLTSASIRLADARALGEVMQESGRRFAVGRRLRQSVNQDQWVLWDHVTGNVKGLTGRIKPGMVAIPVELDPRTSPGPLCRPGDRVNILATLQISPDAPPQIFRIIRNVEVLATGAATMIGTQPDEQRKTFRSYRSISIEVRPEVSLQLRILLAMAKGSAFLEVLPQDAAAGFNEKTDGVINPDEPVLQQLLQARRAAQ